MRYALLLFFLIIVGWATTPFLVALYYGWPDGPGTYGDLFGSVNALFSGLAFAGLLYTISLQRNELALQRDELQLTREELHGAATAQASAAAALADQLREMQMDRQITAALDHFERLNAAWALDARRHIYEMRDTQLDERDGTAREIEMFLNYLNHVGYLLAKDFLPLHPTLEVFYVTTIRCWTKCSSLIMERRHSRGVYMHHLQWLTERAVEYWQEHHPTAPIAIADPATGEKTDISSDDLRRQLKDLANSSSWYVIR